MRLLIIEDERDLNDVIRKKMMSHNYAVDTCFDGKDGLDRIQMTSYDAIILDIMLPSMSGYEILSEMRKQNNYTPVLMLTARASIDDKIIGLNLGADDYLSKPFHLDELLARVRAITRRTLTNKTNRITISSLTLDIDKACAFRGDVAIPLSSKEFAILEYLMINKEVVLSRERIEEHVWNYDYEGGTNVVDVYIRYLRKKIDDGYSPKLIHTVRGLGYVLRESD